MFSKIFFPFWLYYFAHAFLCLKEHYKGNINKFIFQTFLQLFLKINFYIILFGTLKSSLYICKTFKHIIK